MSGSPESDSLGSVRALGLPRSRLESYLSVQCDDTGLHRHRALVDSYVTHSANCVVSRPIDN